MIRRRLISVCVVALFGILLMGQESWPPSTGCTEGADCDGSDLGGESCETLGYDGGTLSCSDKCEYSTTQCSYDPIEFPPTPRGVLRSTE